MPIFFKYIQPQDKLSTMVILLVTLSFIGNSQVMAQLDKKLRNDIMEITLKSVKGEGYQYGKDAKLVIIDSLTFVDSELALQLVNGLNDTLKGDGYYYYYTKMLDKSNLSKKDLTLLVEKLKKINYSNYRTRILIKLAQAYYRNNNPSKVKEYLEMAFEELEKEDSVFSKLFLIGLLVDFNKGVEVAGLTEKLFQKADKLFESNDKFFESFKYSVLVSLIRVSKEQKQESYVEKYLNFLFRNIENMDQNQPKSKALTSLIEVIPDNTDMKFINRITNSIYSINSDFYKIQVFLSLARKSYSQKKTDKMKAFLDSAFKYTINMPIEEKVDILKSIVVVSKELESFDNLKQALDLILQDVDRIEARSYKAESVLFLFQISEEIKQKELFTKVNLIINEFDKLNRLFFFTSLIRHYKQNNNTHKVRQYVEVILKEIDYEALKLLFQFGLCETYIYLNESDNANSMINNVINTYQHLNEKPIHEEEFKKGITEIYVRLKEYKKAYDIASQIDNTEPAKVLTYIYILDAYQKSKIPVKKAK